MLDTVDYRNKSYSPDQRGEAWIRALDRARKVATRKPVYMPRLDAFRVYSPRSEREYRVHPVEVDGQLTYECECRAAEYGLVCWHAACIASLPMECTRRDIYRQGHETHRLTS